MTLGFMLGDGVWEGLRFYNGSWAFLDEHINRLFEAAKAIDLDINLNKAELIAALEKTRVANRITKDAHARVMVTRGIKRGHSNIPRYPFKDLQS